MAIELLNWETRPPAACRGGAVSIGNFDGVHRGHALLMRELRKLAQEVRGPAVALTFDPHPLQLLKPEQFQPVLTTIPERARLLQAHGADHVLVLQTTRAFLQLTAAEFFDQVIQARLAARGLVEGTNFGFGRNREGTIETLHSLCGQHDVRLQIVPPLILGGMPVSSSRVRHALVRGDAREAAELLDRPYRLEGVVATGQRRGQTLGFPTANLAQIPTLVPRDGVYAALAHHQGKHWPAAVNIGPNPTFAEQTRKVEVHLLDFHGDLYGNGLAIDFLERLRDTRPFPTVQHLVEQLRVDVEETRRLAKQPGDKSEIG